METIIPVSVSCLGDHLCYVVQNQCTSSVCILSKDPAPTASFIQKDTPLLLDYYTASEELAVLHLAQHRFEPDPAANQQRIFSY